MIRILLSFVILSFLALSLPTDARAGCFSNCPPAPGNICDSLNDCNPATETCAGNYNGCCAVCNAKACVPNCGGGWCGYKGDGCGGSCGCRECGPFGAQSCGSWTQTYNCQGSVSGCTECGPHGSQSCGNWTQTYDCSGPVSGCNECGPHGAQNCGNWTQTYDCSGSISGCRECGPYLGAWSACDPTTHIRTRTCSDDCGACGGQELSQTCYGQMTGTYFDASDLPVCPADPQALSSDLKITTGTITLTGTPNYGPYATNANGIYTTVSTLLSPGVYGLTIDPGSEFITAPKFNCQGSGLTLTGSPSGCGTQPCETAPTTTHDFGFWKIYGGWWQVINGSVYGQLGIASTIPGTMPAADRYLILANASGDDGLPYYDTGAIDLGTYPGVDTSVTGYNSATVKYAGDPANYAYWKIKMATFDKTTWNGFGQPVYAGGADNYEIYTYTGDVTMDWSPAAGERVIYLIDGNVTVSGNINVPSGASPSFLAVFANGTITYNTDVTNVEGWWVGNSLNFPCVDTTPADGTCDETDVQFTGEGSFIGYSSITLSRDQNILNNSQPAELFTFRPDLIINAPEPLLVSKYIWRYQ